MPPEMLLYVRKLTPILFGFLGLTPARNRRYRRYGLGNRMLRSLRYRIGRTIRQILLIIIVGFLIYYFINNPNQFMKWFNRFVSLLETVRDWFLAWIDRTVSW